MPEHGGNLLYLYFWGICKTRWWQTISAISKFFFDICLNLKPVFCWESKWRNTKHFFFFFSSEATCTILEPLFWTAYFCLRIWNHHHQPSFFTSIVAIVQQFHAFSVTQKHKNTFYWKKRNLLQIRFLIHCQLIFIYFLRAWKPLRECKTGMFLPPEMTRIASGRDTNGLRCWCCSCKVREFFLLFFFVYILF